MGMELGKTRKEVRREKEERRYENRNEKKETENRRKKRGKEHGRRKEGQERIMREHQGIRKGEGRAGEIEERERETKEG